MALEASFLSGAESDWKVIDIRTRQLIDQEEGVSVEPQHVHAIIQIDPALISERLKAEISDKKPLSTVEVQKAQALRFRGQIGALVSHYKDRLTEFVNEDGSVKYEKLLADPQFEKKSKLIEKMRQQSFQFSLESKMVGAVQKENKIKAQVEAFDEQNELWQQVNIKGSETQQAELAPFIEYNLDSQNDIDILKLDPLNSRSEIANSQIENTTTTTTTSTPPPPAAAIVSGPRSWFTRWRRRFRDGGPPSPPGRESDFSYRMRHAAIALFGVVGIMLSTRLADANPWMWKDFSTYFQGNESSNSQTPQSAHTAVETLLPVSGIWDNSTSTVWVGPQANVGIRLNKIPHTETRMVRLPDGQIAQREMVTSLSQAIDDNFGHRTNYTFEKPDFRRANDINGKSPLGNWAQPDLVKSNPKYVQDMGESWLDGFAQAHLGNYNLRLDSQGNQLQFDPYDGQQLLAYQRTLSQNPSLNQARLEVFKTALELENLGKIDAPDTPRASIIHGGQWVVQPDGSFTHQGVSNIITIPGSSLSEEGSMFDAVVVRNS